MTSQLKIVAEVDGKTVERDITSAKVELRRMPIEDGIEVVMLIVTEDRGETYYVKLVKVPPIWPTVRVVFPTKFSLEGTHTPPLPRVIGREMP